MLGFRFAEKWSQEAVPPPFEALRKDLLQSPAVLGRSMWAFSAMIHRIPISAV